MNDRAIELFKQAGEEAYKLCKEHGHPVGEVDHIWVSIMAGTLAELIVKECTNMLPEDSVRNANGVHMFYVIREHFGVSAIGR